MDQSPPKRVTRARAAAKSTDTGVKIATAAAKAKLTRSISTTKRKTRTDDPQEDDEDELSTQVIESAPLKNRSRPKKTLPAQQPEPKVEMKEDPPAKATRGRQRKATEEVPTTQPVRQRKIAVTPPAITEPVRSLRGRAKKAEFAEESIVGKEEPAIRPTRSRAATLMKPSIPRKSVKFEEPDKENAIPVVGRLKGKSKVEVATGLKAKPVRRVATTMGRSTRCRPKVEEQKSSPLSPKKVTQIAVAKDQSDDELATTEKTPMKPFMKSPIKAPGSIFGAAKKLDFNNTTTVNRVTTQDQSASIMASPARRPPQSPFKDSLRLSPQKNNSGSNLFNSPFKFSALSQKLAEDNSPLKVSMLQSPARRPQVSEAGSPTQSNMTTFAVTPKVSTFKVSRFTATPLTVKTPSRAGQMLPPSNVKLLVTNDEQIHEPADDNLETSNASFSGRLSSIMPREIDADVMAVETISEEGEDQVMLDVEETPETNEADVTTVVESKTETINTPGSPSQAITEAFNFREINEYPFEDSDSEDELASDSPSFSPGPFNGRNLSNDFHMIPATPTPVVSMAKTPRTSATVRSAKLQKLGFTPLAKQLTEWMAASPEKSENDFSDSDELSTIPDTLPATLQITAKTHFFDDEMSVRDEILVDQAVAVKDNAEDTILDEADELSVLEPEDIRGFQNGLNFLTSEADQEGEVNDELALLEIASIEHPHDEVADQVSTEQEVMKEELDIEHSLEEEMIEYQVVEQQISEQAVTMTNTAAQEGEQHDVVLTEIADEVLGSVPTELDCGPEPAFSEASQDYADENDTPIDSQLLTLPHSVIPKYATPKRVLGERVFHTVSKIPLKAAADDTPTRPLAVERSASIGRLPAQRPSQSLSRSNTVISYSPSKKVAAPTEEDVDGAMWDAPHTPLKTDTEVWSTVATPARTPRRDLDNALLKGAVVFVDVHTSEGADASLIFTELLTQMGARCVKSWPWSGNPEDGTKIGLTHVVFKDGGRRTLEKSRATGGVVTCVGVGWVLDCERENKWLSEAPYLVDTAMVPRGGHRRRKSMEPKALANMNGTLLPCVAPVKNSRKTMSPTKASFTIAETPFTSKSHRRDSVQWVRSPSNSSTDEDQVLSPVPATPAPEVISAYAEEGIYGEETPGAQTPYFLHKEQLIQKTAPPGKRYFGGDGGNGGFLTEKKDQSVMMRLMAARRKSLQFAPKIGSPLARAAEW
ncbi:hypothetical protein BJ878DRAFT_178814 [Calycina marina]|uniref:BRCT domain-containing protein n=1 Tax=Calycina marina TaxID=1763456 RepID=A0A9P7YYT0_9HELO|nr:hypothetical protein BJ878DRAFT_178814 [Calycina marina]